MPVSIQLGAPPIAKQWVLGAAQGAVRRTVL